MKKGFTLIELLIVISIIGILAVALLPNILSAPATARDAGRKTTLNSVLVAMEQYKATNGAYPALSATAPDVNGCVPESTMAKYFKGGTVPVGAANASTTAETPFGACSMAAGANPTKVAYCPLAANNQNYSYIVAIRLEKPFSGANALDLTKTCAGMVAGGTFTEPKLATGDTNWYYLVQ
jgi:prepilin-type N-terminal cleavage/methylation domain-containing protein